MTAVSREEIRARLSQHKIDSIQLDPNGYCNNKCWFCPVAYAPNPGWAAKAAPLKDIEKVLREAAKERGNLFASSFGHVWMSHYNEAILHPEFEGLLSLMRELRMHTTLLSNAIPMTVKRCEMVARYPDVVVGACFNVPAAEPEAYARYTGQPPKVWELVKENLTIFRSLYKKDWSIVVNGVDDSVPQPRNRLGPAAPVIPYGDTQKQIDLFRELFPGINVFMSGQLVDRAGHLARRSVLSNDTEFYPKRNQDVTGCQVSHEVGGRPFGWLHVNAAMQPFLCCDDYSFDYCYGDLTKTTIREAWFSDEHVHAIERSFSGLCRTCSRAVRS